MSASPTPASSAGAHRAEPTGRSLPLVGREQELSLLRGVMEAALAGHGSALILAGDSGIGKTRLTQAAREHAEQLGFTTTVGVAFSTELGVPFAAWADALLPVVRSLEPAQLTLLTRGGSAELLQIIPTLASSRDSPRPIHGSPAEQKARLFWTVHSSSCGSRSVGRC